MKDSNEAEVNALYKKSNGTKLNREDYLLYPGGQIQLQTHEKRETGFEIGIQEHSAILLQKHKKLYVAGG